MTKRSRSSDGRYLTGGTGDVKPQILTLDTGLNTAGEYIVTEHNLPVARIGASKDRATVLEILRVTWYDAIEDLDDPVMLAGCYLTTSPNVSTGVAADLATISADVRDPNTFAMFIHQSYTVSTAEGVGNRDWPAQFDFTDGAGNGILIATDKISTVGFNKNGTAATRFTCKILYRLVNVGIMEYVGIVQSQQ